MPKSINYVQIVCWLYFLNQFRDFARRLSLSRVSPLQTVELFRWFDASWPVLLKELQHPICLLWQPPWSTAARKVHGWIPRFFMPGFTTHSSLQYAKSYLLLAWSQKLFWYWIIALPTPMKKTSLVMMKTSPPYTCRDEPTFLKWPGEDMVQDVADEHPAIQLWRAGRRHTPAVHCHHHWLPLHHLE